MTQRLPTILRLLVALLWSSAADANPRFRRGPPPGGFGRRPMRMAPPAYPAPCTGNNGSCGFVDDLDSLTSTESSCTTVETGSASDDTVTEPAPTTQQSTGSASETPASTPAAPSVSKTKDVPYFYQYNNALSPGASCQNTSLAMLLKYYGVNITPDQITSRFGKSKAQTPEGAASVFNTLASEAGIPQRVTAQRSKGMSQLNAQLQEGTPTVVYGWFTGSGHVVLATGYNGSSYTVNDPAGKWNGSWKGGYSGGSTSGDGVTYSERSFYSAVATSDGSNYLAPWWLEVSP